METHRDFVRNAGICCGKQPPLSAIEIQKNPLFRRTRDLVQERRLELPRRSPHAPQTCLSTIPTLLHCLTARSLYRFRWNLSTAFLKIFQEAGIGPSSETFAPESRGKMLTKGGRSGLIGLRGADRMLDLKLSTVAISRLLSAPFTGSTDQLSCRLHPLTIPQHVGQVMKGGPFGPFCYLLYLGCINCLPFVFPYHNRNCE